MKPKKNVPVVAKPQAAASPEKDKLYQRRLEDLALPTKPIVPQPAQVRQFQLAHLAATLAKGADAGLKASELANNALLIWKAAGKALAVEEQARVMVKGLFWYNQHDWQEHGKALIDSQNDLEGGVPGRNAADEIRDSYVDAQRKAGQAVNDVWKYADWKGATMKCLFPSDKISEDDRAQLLVRLVEYARAAVEKADAVPWTVKDADPLKASIIHAWHPLGVWDDAMFDKAVKQAKECIEKPGGVQMDHVLAFYPFVARWLAVMRHEMTSDAKKRA